MDILKCEANFDMINLNQLIDMEFCLVFLYKAIVLSPKMITYIGMGRYNLHINIGTQIRRENDHA